jgi:hypothetical protein
MAFPKRHKFRGRSYKLIWRRPRKSKAEAKLSKTKNIEVYGKCQPPYPGCKIYISKQELKSDPLGFLETLLHECAGHGCNWDLDEDCVRETFEDTIKLLRRMKMEIKFRE